MYTFHTTHGGLHFDEVSLISILRLTESREMEGRCSVEGDLRTLPLLQGSWHALVDTMLRSLDQLNISISSLSEQDLL